MPKRRTLVIICFICLSVIVAIPLGIDKFVIGNNISSNISNTEWVGFLGSYVGAIIGGIISLIGIIWTIRFTREQNRADRELQIRPFFDISFINDHYKDHGNTERAQTNECLGYISIITFEENKEIETYKTGLIFMFLKNVGAGPAVNISFEVKPETINREYQARFNNMNFGVTTSSLMPNEIAWLSVETYCNAIAPKKEDVSWQEDTLVVDYDRKKFKIPDHYKVKIFMKYNDLLGNQFIEEININVTYMMNCKRDSDLLYSCDIHLSDISMPKKI